MIPGTCERDSDVIEHLDKAKWMSLHCSYHLMIGGSVLLVFCLFMVSITQPEIWQVCNCTHHSAKRMNGPRSLQLFILQGVGIGAAIGMMYIPGVGICSHYFRKRRAFAIGIATSVCHLCSVPDRGSFLVSHLGLGLGWCTPSHYAKSLVSRSSWLS